ncbi:hypothetical protein HY639_01750 [Candidatus Woesearchaeota archaeon]|nr:hypothetical protein [Candidatus Woesearchaeota archaeon]
MNKKGDLALSVNAIVIVVISFVVLGLALTLTRSIFKFAGERAESVIPLTELEAKPTPDNPITISDTVSITRNGKQTLSVGYYNKNDYPAVNARFSMAICQDEDGETIDADKRPIITSPAQTTKASEAKGYKIILTENGLESGVYICTVMVHKANIDVTLDQLGERGEDKPVYDTKQFFLKVTA